VLSVLALGVVCQGVAGKTLRAVSVRAVAAALGDFRFAFARECHVAVRACLASAAAALAVAVRDDLVASGRTQVELPGRAAEAVPRGVVGRAVWDCGHTDVVVRGQSVRTLAALALA